MSDIVNEAANVLVPLAAMGAGAAVQEASKEVGRDVHDAARAVLAKIKGLLRPEPDAADIDAALREAIRKGIVEEDDLRRLLPGSPTSLISNTIGDIRAGNVITGSIFQAPITFNAGPVDDGDA